MDNLRLTEKEKINWEAYQKYTKEFAQKGHKRCKHCNKTKLLSEFYAHVLKKFKVSDICKECAKRENRERRMLRKLHEEI